MSEIPERIWAHKSLELSTDPAVRGYWSDFWCWSNQQCYVRAYLYDKANCERDAALARAERAEKALEQAIVLANIRIEYRTEHGDPEGGTYDYVCCDSCGTPFMSALAAYLKAKEKQ